MLGLPTWVRLSTALPPVLSEDLQAAGGSLLLILPDGSSLPMPVAPRGGTLPAGGPSPLHCLIPGDSVVARGLSPGGREVREAWPIAEGPWTPAQVADAVLSRLSREGRWAEAVRRGGRTLALRDSPDSAWRPAYRDPPGDGAMPGEGRDDAGDPELGFPFDLMDAGPGRR